MYYIIALLALSLAGNIFAIFKIRKIKKAPVATTDARDLLHDITTRGRAVLDIRVIDPENLFVVRRGN